ncbi:MAG: hypothetical protein JNM62_14375 [Flavobacteriales bacterium]|nr:hypothetical protein [Flavobacteriales bacterium]
MCRYIATIIFTLTVAHATHATRYHVRAGATGNDTGFNWNDALVSLQSALSLSVAGDEIWVAAGQYKPTDSFDQMVSFQVPNGVNLYGGFAGGETDLSQRIVANNLTVLNGDIGQPGVDWDNSYTVIAYNNINTEITLDGFRIMNGNSANGFHGGGLRVTNSISGHVLVKNCHIVKNVAQTYGGGVYLAAATLTLEDCILEDNDCGGGSGGAICNGNNNNGYSNLSVIGTRFIKNKGRLGACIYNTVQYADLLFDRCAFTDNTSLISLISVDGFDAARMLNSCIIGNTVDEGSGNILFVNSFGEQDVFSLTNCTIAHNFNLQADESQDVVVRFDDAHHVITNCIIHGNTRFDGRQINSGPAITYCLIEAGDTGGEGNVDGDPLFAAPFNAEPTDFDVTAFDYSLQSGSPAIDAGSDQAVIPEYSRDLADLPRIQGVVVDMGCYESDQSVAVERSGPDQHAYFYDAQMDQMVFHAANAPSTSPIALFDATGKLVHSFTPRGSRYALTLDPGTYTAVSPELGVLRFIVH